MSPTFNRHFAISQLCSKEQKLKHYQSFAAHTFNDLETCKFDPKMYSRLKFGCDTAARKMGHELAEKFFNQHTDVLLANRIVVIASPYNYVRNAATVMTEHFIDRLNELLVFANGEHVEYSVIHRKVSYTADYGFLTKEKRRGLIDNDSFYMNHEYLRGKLLLFVDDVRITGTHEDKLREILLRDNVDNDAFFLYYGDYMGKRADIEGQLNFAAITCLQDYVDLTKEPYHHIIIRPIKYLLGQKTEDLVDVLHGFSDRKINDIYNGCLAEGYYKMPQYQKNFARIVAEKQKRSYNSNS